MPVRMCPIAHKIHTTMAYWNTVLSAVMAPVPNAVNASGVLALLALEAVFAGIKSASQVLFSAGCAVSVTPITLISATMRAI